MTPQQDPVDLETLLIRHRAHARIFETLCAEIAEHDDAVSDEQFAHWYRAEAESFRAVLGYPAATLDEIRAQLRCVVEDEGDRMRDAVRALAWQKIALNLELAVERSIP